MNDILLLSGVLVKKIWGGNYFKDVLKITNENEKYGELWSLSAIKDYDSIILNGKYKGLTLNEVYNLDKSLFAYSKVLSFPTLIKIISAYDDLSVQVHPNDEYALKNENSIGKTEGWLILSCEENSYIVYGHNAKDKEELKRKIDNNEYDTLLNKVKVKKGDFFKIPSGMIHAIGKGVTLLEIQQSSDITYRFYDYNRVDDNGNHRPLHINKALDVTTYNDDLSYENVFALNKELIWKNEYFEVRLFNIKDELILSTKNDYLMVSVIYGNVKVKDTSLSLGNSFIITSNNTVKLLSENGKIVVSKYIGK